MLPHRKLVYNFAVRSYNVAGQQITMSTSGALENGRHPTLGSIANAPSSSLPASQERNRIEFTFQPSSPSQCSTETPAHCANLHGLDSPTSLPDRMIQSHPYTLATRRKAEHGCSDEHQVKDQSRSISRRSVPLESAPVNLLDSALALTRNAGISLRPSEKLSYPDLSLSSFATTNDDAFLPSAEHSTASSWNKSTKAIGTASTSITPNGPSSATLSIDESFRSPRGFHIPTARLQQALGAEPNSAASFWQYTLYRGPKGDGDKVKLHYCKTKEATETVSRLFLNEEVIGFDIEWMAQARSTDGIQKNIALIQIACEDRIALFHIARYPGAVTVDDFVAPAFKRIMETPRITKVGVAIKGDCTRLKNFLNIHCQGLFELSHLHKLIKYCSGEIDKVNRLNVRLADQVQEHLKLPLLKGDVQTSDWSRDLDYQQTQYAASDSYAGFQLYHVMEAKRKSFDPVPPRPAHAELNLAISLGDQDRTKQPPEVLEDEDESSDVESVSSSDISIEELAREYFHISLSNDVQVKPKARRAGNKPASISPKAQISKATSGVSVSSSSAVPHVEVSPKNAVSSPKLELANQFVADYTPPPNRRVTPQALRAYSLWHQQGLSIPEVAKILRSPAIQNRTVITYLCDAISICGLRYESAKILSFSSEYSYQPFIKAHKDLFEKARKEVCRAQMPEERRASDHDRSESD